MLSRLSSHVRHNVVGYLALFFALSGGAFAANTYIRTTDTIPSSSDLTGTYGNPVIANGKVTSGKLANGSVTTSKFDSGAKAPDADKLDGLDSTAFGAGAIMGEAFCFGSGSCSSPGPGTFLVSPSGRSEIGATTGEPFELTPNAVLVAGDLAVRVGASWPEGTGAQVTFTLAADNTPTSVSCTVVLDNGQSCHSGNATATIPAGSAVTLVIQTNAGVIANEVLFGWRLIGPV